METNKSFVIRNGLLCYYATNPRFNRHKNNGILNEFLKPKQRGTMKKKKSFFQKILNLADNSVEKNIKTQEKINTLSIGQIAKRLEITTNATTTALMRSGLIEKKGNWWIVTDLGQTQGGIQKYNAKTKQKYTLWENSILKNESLLKEIKTPTKKTSYKEKVKKGEEYEIYIAEIYRAKGYHVTEHGKERGREDHGIDLIAKKEKEIILIQCKNWKENGKWKINHEKIKSFQTDARNFVEERPLLRSYSLTARYVISNNVMHPSAIKHIEEMQKRGKKIDFEIIKII